jgi:hypothetical protein
MIEMPSHEIEITPEMKRAGAKILMDYFAESPLIGCLEEDIACEVFAAMSDCALVVEVVRRE